MPVRVVAAATGLFDFSDPWLLVWRVGVVVVLAGLAGYVVFLHKRSIPRRIQVAGEDQRMRIVGALATAINAKDNITFEHVRRVQIYAEGLGQLVGCDALELRALRKAALLHDVGKIAVPDSVLTKPGKLTADEFDQMKVHPVVGAEILERVQFPFPIVPIVRHHHERWDGRGYPDGLKGEQIPLCARILSIVDCFDAVREDRQYRKGMTRDEATALVMAGSGSLYDPRLVGLFLTHLPEFEARVQAERNYNAGDFGVQPTSPHLSDAGKRAQPAAGLAA